MTTVELESGERPSLRTYQRKLGALILVASLIGGCSDNVEVNPAEASIPGLASQDEIPLREFDGTLRVGDLPPLNIRASTEEFLADAGRVDEDPGDLVCIESNGSVGCYDEDKAHPAITGLTFGGPDVKAWSWGFVPENAAAVQFTDQAGETAWQRPVDRLVVFPDTIEDNSDGSCPCRMDALNADGDVIASVDVSTFSYITD